MKKQSKKNKSNKATQKKTVSQQKASSSTAIDPLTLVPVQTSDNRPDDNPDYNVDQFKEDVLKLRDKTESKNTDVHTKLNKEKNKNYKPMARPGFGTEGIPIELVTNWLDMTVPPFKMYQYDVTIVREKINRTVNTAGFVESKARAIRRRDENNRVFMKFVEHFPKHFQNERTPENNEKTMLLYDRSKILFSPKCITQFREHLKERILDEDQLVEETPTYTIEVKPTNAEVDVDVDLFSQQYQADPDNRMRNVLAVMDQLCRQKMYIDPDWKLIGKSLYEFNNVLNKELGNGCQLVHGTYQSPALHGTMNGSNNIGWKFHLNINMIASPFYKKHEETENMSAMNFFIEILELSSMPNSLKEFQIVKLNKIIHCMLFKTTHNKFKFKAYGLSMNFTARTYKIKIERDSEGFTAGEEVNLIQYFYRRYNISLKYDNWPLLEKKSTQGKYTYFPVELCTQVDHNRVQNSKLTGKQQALVVRNTVIPPGDRLEMITKRATDIAEKHNNDPSFKDLGIRVNPKLMTVIGRTGLSPPKVLYKNTVNIRLATWNMVNQSLNMGVDCSKDCLALISVENGQRTHSQFLRGGRGGGNFTGQTKSFSADDAYEFYCRFQPHLESMGLSLPYEPHLYVTASANVNDRNYISTVIEEFDSQCRSCNSNRKIVILINSEKDEKVYALAKYKCGKLGIFCQVILAANAEKIMSNPWNSAKLMSNIALKLNAKLSGINHVIDDGTNLSKTKVINSIFKDENKKKHVLVLGLDVTHDTLGRSVSIAALISSIDSPPSRYVARDIIMLPKTEIVEHGKMELAIIEALKIYKYFNGELPKHIIYYRDGVSDGQFVQVLLNELAAMQDACLHISSEYKPPITFVVVQKRHQTRIFRKIINKKDKVENQNVPPGTVVDSEITHPFEFNYFMIPHKSIQGTSRPLYCYVLHDDMNMNADLMQQLTHYLCYTYARATNAVSLPAPVYYAHHACTQAKMRLLGHQLENSSQSTFLSNSPEKQWSPQEIQRLQKIVEMHPTVADGMHFQ